VGPWHDPGRERLPERGHHGALCTVHRERHALRQYLREWLYDGTDKATPCTTQVNVRACFVPLLRWVLRP